MIPAPGQPLNLDVAEGGIATLTLNRPDKRNALSIALRDAISDVLHEWVDDASVRVVVLTGAPPAFSAGFDLGEFADPALARTIRHSSARYHRAVWSFLKPTVAAVIAREITKAPQRTLEATKRYLIGNQGFGFEDSFRVEHDDVFDNFLPRGIGPGGE